MKQRNRSTLNFPFFYDVELRALVYFVSGNEDQSQMIVFFSVDAARVAGKYISASAAATKCNVLEVYIIYHC